MSKVHPSVALSKQFDLVVFQLSTFTRYARTFKIHNLKFKTIFIFHNSHKIWFQSKFFTLLTSTPNTCFALLFSTIKNFVITHFHYNSKIQNVQHKYLVNRTPLLVGNTVDINGNITSAMYAPSLISFRI